MGAVILPVPFTDEQWLRLRHHARLLACSELVVVRSVIAKWIRETDDPHSEVAAESMRRLRHERKRLADAD